MPSNKMKRDKEKIEFSERLCQAVLDCYGRDFKDPTLNLRAEWARLLKVDHSAVRRWFIGQAKPEADRCRIIAELLEVDFSYLYTGRRTSFFTPSDIKLVQEITEKVEVVMKFAPNMTEQTGLRLIAISFRDINLGMKKEVALDIRRLRELMHIFEE